MTVVIKLDDKNRKPQNRAEIFFGGRGGRGLDDNSDDNVIKNRNLSQFVIDKPKTMLVLT